MIDRTKKITSAKNRAFSHNIDYAFVKPNADLETQEAANEQVQKLVKNGKFEMKQHALRYEEIIRKHK